MSIFGCSRLLLCLVGFVLGCPSGTRYAAEPPTYFVPGAYPGPTTTPADACSPPDVAFGTGHISINSGADYDHPYSGNLHNGLDFGGAIGAAILAPAPGLVVAKGRPPVGGAGRMLAIDAGRDIRGNHVFYLLAHLDRVDVKVGEQVRRGQPIAQLGKTGGQRVPHLHFSAFTTETGAVRRRVLGYLYLGDHDLLDPTELAMGGQAFAPFQAGVDYGDSPRRFTGFSHPICLVEEAQAELPL